MVLERAGKEFGTEFGENFASGAGGQLAVGVSESAIWLGGSIICASMWQGAYNVLNNTSIGKRRLRAAVALPTVATSALMGYAVYLRTNSPRPLERQAKHSPVHPSEPHRHDHDGNPIPKPKQKWWSRWLFGKKPADGDVERGTSLKASGYDVHVPHTNVVEPNDPRYQQK